MYKQSRQHRRVLHVRLARRVVDQRQPLRTGLHGVAVGLEEFSRDIPRLDDGAAIHVRLAIIKCLSICIKIIILNTKPIILNTEFIDL